MTGELTENPFDRNSSSMIYNRDTGQRVSPSPSPGSLMNWAAGEDDGDYPSVSCYYDLGPAPQSLGDGDGAILTREEDAGAGLRNSQQMRFAVHPIASGQVEAKESPAEAPGGRLVLASQVTQIALRRLCFQSTFSISSPPIRP